MQIIPAINCPDFECVKEKIKKAQGLFTLTRQSKQNWVQIDIADGKFTPHKTWNKPVELSTLNSHLLSLNIEAHLMVKNPLRVVDDWAKAGAQRIIIHLEAIDAREFSLIWPQISRMAEISLAINPETAVEKLEPFFNIRSSQDIRSCDDHAIKFVQLLAVSPGKSGQKFDPRILEKIKFLKKNFPDLTIEVDGGINKDTAKLCKEAGADILVSTSYIWDSPNPKSAFFELANV